MSRTTDTRPPELGDAKRPLTFLAGPYGHPFHTAAVTVPLGAWLCSFVFDVVGLASADPAPWAVASRIVIGIGLVGAMLAIVLGMLDYLRIPDRTRASSTATMHMGVNLLVCGGYTVQFLYRLTTDDIPVFVVVVSAVSLLLLGIAGWLGGKLAYRYGVRVADEATQAQAFRRS